ncbi:hypothetical protein ACTFIW_004773 [Dictyostelium discoideum]
MPELEVYKKSVKKAFRSDMVVVVESLDIIPEVIGSMKTKFLNEFFISGKFIDPITYEQFCKNSSGDDPCSTKILLYGLLVDAMITLSSFAIYGKNGVLTGIDEQRFLKDNETFYLNNN